MGEAGQTLDRKLLQAALEAVDYVIKVLKHDVVQFLQRGFVSDYLAQPLFSGWVFWLL